MCNTGWRKRLTKKFNVVLFLFLLLVLPMIGCLCFFKLFAIQDGTIEDSITNRIIASPVYLLGFPALLFHNVFISIPLLVVQWLFYSFLMERLVFRIKMKIK